MKFITVGRDQDGRSYAEEIREVLVHSDGPINLDRVWSTMEFPPEVTVARRRADEHPRRRSIDSSSSWTIARFAPGHAMAMHCTETIDYQTVIAGSVTLHLESGEVEMHTGDMCMIPGLLHAWTAGPEGSVVSAVTLGLTDERPANDDN